MSLWDDRAWRSVRFSGTVEPMEWQQTGLNRGTHAREPPALEWTRLIAHVRLGETFASSSTFAFNTFPLLPALGSNRARSNDCEQNIRVAKHRFQLHLALAC